MKKQISISISEMARLIDGVVTGNGDLAVRGVQGPGGTDPELVVICRDARESSRISSGVPVISVPGKIPEGRTGIEVPDPQKAFVRVLEIFSEDRSPSPGVHDTAIVGESADLSPSCSVGPLCVICDGAVIGDHAVLEAQVYVGPDVVIGPRTRIEANTVLREGTIVGEDCLIHSGSVIGSDGFGFVPDFEKGHARIPQLGRVRIGSKVKVGACVTIDRATLEETVIGDGTVIDNHVHIGHNAQVGRKCILVAMTGIAGSSVLEDGVIMAARSGVSDHVTVGKRAQVAANAGATKNVPPGMTVSGFPARDHREEMKKQVLLGRLPGIAASLKELRAEVEELKRKMAGGGDVEDNGK
jgi:UDP-3-O-[3-hydroxymyristoyl] glucosamine N-acyltransferase